MLASVLAIFIVIVAGTGIMLYFLLHNEMITRVDESLKRTTREYVLKITDPVSPKTGQPYSDASAFLYDVMADTVAAPHEGFVAVVGNSLKWTAPANVELRLEDDPKFLSWSTSVAVNSDAVFLRTVTTDKATYRAVVLPAPVNGDTSDGRYIVAFDLDAESADLNAVFVPYIWVSCGALVLAALISWLVTGRLLTPISALNATARRISERDLTQRINVNAKGDLGELTHSFNSMLDRVETAVNSNRQLLDDVGHELRTPVTIVRGHLELVNPEDPEDVRETRDIALEELDRMSLLIDDLLLLAKAEKNNFVDVHPTDLNDFMERVFAKAQLLGVREWSLELGQSRVVNVDQQRLTQAILQLCENAVKYSDESSPVVLTSSSDPGQDTVISVRDQGIGIQEDDLATVFDRFARGRNSKRADGSGLGLSIAKTIVGMHGGSLDVTSEFGVGSVFTITLPEGFTAPDSSDSARKSSTPKADSAGLTPTVVEQLSKGNNS